MIYKYTVWKIKMKTFKAQLRWGREEWGKMLCGVFCEEYTVPVHVLYTIIIIFKYSLTDNELPMLLTL